MTRSSSSSFSKYFPILEWLQGYGKETFVRDALAAVVVTMMLVPQALAYAMLAGLPAEVGLYASMIPLLLYAVFGTSATLAVGPVAVASLMTASALSGVAEVGSPEYVGAALVLAALSGLMLLLMGVLKLGFLANFLSHPVISGFVTASGVLIAASQAGKILGVDSSGESLFTMASRMWETRSELDVPTVFIGVGVLVFLYLCRAHLKNLLLRWGLAEKTSDLLTKAAPVVSVIVTTVAAWSLNLGADGVALVGEVPSGLPNVGLPPLEGSLWVALIPAAMLISLVGFVESVSVAQTLAAKRRQRIDPNKELIALGFANMGAGVGGGAPVSGGFSRSVVNFEAGAQTPIAGALTALGITLAALTLTGLLAFLPEATLAAIIIVAVGTLIDFPAVRRTLAYSKADAFAMIATIVVTLAQGVELGILGGVAASLVLHLYRTSRPHSAVVGRIRGTEHFRNVKRFDVETSESVVILRVDESLYFANARYLEDTILELSSQNERLRDFVLACQAVNEIDASALESLEAINHRLKEAGITFHLAEVKGPVMDRLRTTHFCEQLTGQVFLSTYEAWVSLRPTQSVAQPC